MGARIEAPGGGVEADFGQEGVEELFLMGARIVAGEVFAGGMSGNGEGFFGDADKAGLKFCEEGGDFRRFPAGFVAFKKSVVGVAGVAPEVSHAAGEGQEFFEVGGNGGEVGLFARFYPGGTGEAAGPLVFLDEFGGDAGGATVVVSPAGETGGLGAVGGRVGRFTSGNPVADFRGCGEAVGEAGDLGGLLCAETVGFGREEGFLVPTEQSAGGAEEGQFPTPGTEFLVGFRQGWHRTMMRQENSPGNVFV